MSSSVRVAPIIATVSPRLREQALAGQQLIAGASLLAAIDAVVALGVLAGVLIVTSLDAMPDGLDAFLSMRVTLRNVLLLAALATGWPVIFRLCGLYTRVAVASAKSERLRVLIACSLGSVLALIVPALSRGGGLEPGSLIYFWIATILGTLALREVRRTVVHGRRTPRRVLIVGTGPRARGQWQALQRDPHADYELAGFVDTADSTPVNDEVGRRRMGTLDQLEAILMQHAIDEVVVALPIKSLYPEIQEALLVCERVGVRTKYQADLFTTEVAWPRYDNPGSPMVTMHVVPDDHRLAIKRLFDVSAAAAGIVLLAPVMLAAAAAIKLTSRGPVLFAQERYGLNRRRFMMLKFRTMVVDAEQLQAALEEQNEVEGPVFKIARDPRITRVGRFLRRTSIDELPQLFNILRGDMTLVGPRPLPLRDVTRITRAADMRRFSVRPGLTGLWQVSGRSTLNFSDWVTLDLTYIDRWSLALDWLILLRTIPAVVRGTGAH